MKYVIGELIEEHKKSSWQALEDAIATANLFRRDNRRGGALDDEESDQTTGEVKITIDRRKLQKLAEGNKNIPLSAYELELLDTFFVKRSGTGLAEVAMFRRQEDLFHVLGKADGVSFFVGARYVESLDTDVIARWDVSAFNALRDRIPNKTATDSFDVASRNVGRPLHPKEWSSLRRQATGNVIVSIGSPIASASSEYLLSEMFDIRAYNARSTPPPVCFAHGNADYPSAFVREPTEVAGMRDDSAALLIDSQAHVSCTEGAEYGVVVGQRTGPDHAAFVVAGNTGPGTMAAAEFFATGQISAALPKYATTEKQPVLVALISADIGSVVTDRRIDKRTIGNTKLVGRPFVFEYLNRQWMLVE